MKKVCIALLFFVLYLSLDAQRVGIGTASPDSSAILDLSSSEDGFLMPRMTTVEIEAIANPAEGLLVYNTEDQCIYSFDGAWWRANCTWRFSNTTPPSDLAWKDEADPQTFDLEGAVSFVLNGKGYVGTGYAEFFPNYLDLFHRYDPRTRSWTQVASFPHPRTETVSFIYKGEAYVGLGESGPGNNEQDFYKYDPSADMWVDPGLFAFPDNIAGAVSFGLNGIPYICGGSFGNGSANKTLYYYDTIANKFLFGPDYPEINLIGAVAFSVNGIGYVGLGNGGNKFYAFNPATNMWSPIADYPVSGRSDAVAFVLGQKGYVGTGGDQNDFYAYDPVTGTWTMAGEVPNITGPGLSSAVVFEINQRAFVGTGMSGSAFYRDFKSYGFDTYIPAITAGGEAVWINTEDPDQNPENEIQDIEQVLAKGNDANGYQIKFVGWPEFSQDAATKGFVDMQVDTYINLDSVLAKGNDANGQKILNLANPTNPQDAATKSYADNQLQNISDVLSQNLGLNPGNANENSLTNLDKLGVGTNTPSGKMTVLDTSKNAITIRTPDNLKSNGIAFQNPNNVYTWSMFREDIGLNKAKLIFAGGQDTETDSLPVVFTRYPFTNPSSNALMITNGTTVGTFNDLGWNHSSDIRLKANISSIEHPLDRILALRGVRFNWKTNPEGADQIGFIAQEAKEVFPEVVSLDDNGNYTMSYQNLVAPLVEAVKEQQGQIETLKEQNAALLEMVRRLEEKVFGGGQ